MCGAEKQSHRVRAHEGFVGKRKSQWTTDFSRNSGTYIVYNYHVTCSNSSLSLTMVTPTSHFLLSIGYVVQARFCGRMHLPLSPKSTTFTGQGDIPIYSTWWTCFNIYRIHSTCGHGDISAITLLMLSLGGRSCLNIHWYTAPVDMMTFRWSHRSYQSICEQYPPYSHLQVTLIYYMTWR